MRLNFQRITSSGKFVPEIDGLRFIAIFTVVIHHLHGFFTNKLLLTPESPAASFFNHLISNGHLGVPLFFTISGYILGMPFASQYLGNAGKVSLRNYFLRRITRLEPPYILAMTLLMISLVFLTHKIPVKEGLISYLCSLLYIHGFLFPGEFPKINGVAWSLEIEVQFYIIAPLAAWLIYRIRNAVSRRTVLCLFMLIFISWHHGLDVSVRSLPDYFHWFLAGFLLADLKLNEYRIFQASFPGSITGILLLIGFFAFDTAVFKSALAAFGWECCQLAAVILLFHLVLQNGIFRFLKWKSISSIGGMCYSIYLLHYPVISLLGNFLLKFRLGMPPFVLAITGSLILLVAIGIISAAFFLLVERPCMDKHWYQKINRKF
jgi:peptidoglycan/LPS O-acetylase OafA/YrhL